MSQTDEVQVGMETSVKTGTEGPVKPVSGLLLNDNNDDSEQVVNSAATTTTTHTPCQEINKDPTPSDDVTTNNPEENTDNSTPDVMNSAECVDTEHQPANSNTHNAADLATSDEVTKVEHDGDASPEEEDVQERSIVSIDDTAETTTTSDQISLSSETELALSEEYSSAGLEELRSGSSLSFDFSQKSTEEDGTLLQLDQVERTKVEENQTITTSANSLLTHDLPSYQTEGTKSFLAEKVTSDRKELTNQEVPTSTPQKGEQLIVDLPPAESVAKATVGEAASAASKDCSATAAVATSVLQASAAPPCSQSTSEERQQSSGALSPDDSNSAPSVYSVKWVMFKNNKVPVITQNENGPCPLIAIMNVLLLQKKIQFPALMEMVTSDQLMSYLGECIFENVPKNITEDSRLNYEQNMQDAMAVFHKLQTGLDVNVRFTGVCDFEYTPELIIFDLLEIRLYHGWLVDPQEPQVGTAVGNCSYNQLVEKIIAQKSSEKQELVTEALLAENFLESSASQLTYHGLCELSTSVKEGELCVCFRNNHFSTLYKHKGELFILVTDQGFLTESNVVWETLSNVEGDCHFVDANFHTYTKPELAPLVVSEIPAGSDQQIDQDYLVALSLQQEQQLTVDQETGWNPQQQQQQQQQQQGAPAMPAVQLSDHELALKLQEEEDRRAAAAYQQQQQQQQQSPSGTQQPNQPRSPGSQSSSSSGSRRPRDRERKEKDKDGCTVL